MSAHSPNRTTNKPIVALHHVATFALLITIIAMLPGCGRSHDEATIEFWTFGSEGDAVGKLLEEFHQKNPGVRIRLQQIPWSAAHEKLVTAFAGDRLPDVCQLGNTWIPEFAALGALENLSDRIESSKTISPDDHFEGVWQTNCVEQKTLGIPWYVDTRILFYRKDMLAEAGYDQPPTTWAAWTDCLQKIEARTGRPPLLMPIGEFEPLVIMGLQQETPLLREGGRFGDFESADFRGAFDFYCSTFANGLAPAISGHQISNLWQALQTDQYAMYISGPWNVAQFRSRLPEEELSKWSTAPLPGPNGPGRSSAGGCSLVLFRAGSRPAASDSANTGSGVWKLVEFLSQPETQLRFFELVGNLPAHRTAWKDRRFTDDPWIVAFRDQLERVRSMPQVPEWERIAMKIASTAEQVVRGKTDTTTALSNLNRQVDDILEKRRWMLQRVTLLSNDESVRNSDGNGM